jgi:hypothetical protein
MTSSLKTCAIAIGVFLALACASTEAAALTAPFNVAASPKSATSVTVTWSDSNTQLTEFVIQRSVKPDNGFKIIAYAAASARSYVDSGLTTGGTYYYRLRAKLNGTTSTLSNTASVTVIAPPSDTTAPPVPTGLRTGTVTCGRVDIFWTVVTDSGGSGLRGYNVYRNGVYFRQILAPNASTTDLTVAASTGYTYGVAAIDNAGNQSAQAYVSTTTPSCSTAATATPTRTATRTPTRTATPVPTVTRTATAVSGATATALRTATRTPTPAATRTPTATRTATRTPTPVPTQTATTFDPTLVGFVPGIGSAMDVAISGTKAFVASDPFGFSVIDVSSPSMPTVLGAADQAFVGAHVAFGGTRAVVTGASNGYAHLWVLDVSAPATPSVVGELATTLPAAGFFDVAMNGTGTLAVTAMGGAGIWAIDLTNPAAPVVRGTYDTPGIAYAVALNSAGTLAYVADGSGGVRIVSVSNPSAPSLVGAVAVSGIQRDIAVQSTIAYVIDQMGRLVTFDVSTPSAPRQIGALVLGRYAYNVAVEGSLAVVHDANSTAYLDVINISSPTNPVVIGSIAVDAGGAVKGVALSGGRAYVADGTSGLRVYDLGTTPSLRSEVQDDFASTHLATTGTLSVVTGADMPTNTARFQIVNGADPTLPRIIGELATTLPAAGFFDVAINDAATLAVTAMGGAGIWVIDITNRAAPFVRGSYDTPGIAYAVAVNGTGSLAYVADGSGGIKILSLANPSAPALAGSLAVSGIQRDIAVQGAVAYLADQMGRLVTIDVATPSAPRQLGAVALGRYVFNVAVEGTRAIVHSANSTAYVDVVDVASPATPVTLGSVAVDAAGAIKGIALAGGRAYVAASSQGVKVYDLATPSAPRLSASAETVGDAMDITVEGGTASVADSTSTVSIIDLFAN